MSGKGKSDTKSGEFPVQVRMQFRKPNQTSILTLHLRTKSAHQQTSEKYAAKSATKSGTKSATTSAAKSAANY